MDCITVNLLQSTVGLLQLMIGVIQELLYFEIEVRMGPASLQVSQNAAVGSIVVSFFCKAAG